MISVRVWSHKDGDHLVVVRIPWWYNIYEWITDRLCPCCSWRGWLIEKLPNKLTNPWYNFHTKLYTVLTKHEKELYKLPIPKACVASEAIFGKVDCYLDTCEYHVNAEDAMEWKA